MVALCVITLASAVRAHEVLPSIADMERDGDRLVFDVRLNLESFVAGIDQAEVTDTNEAAEADTYDALRALDPAALAAEFRAFWPAMAEGIDIRAGDARLDPVLEDVTVQPEEDIEVPRTSELQFSVTLPEGAETASVGWDRSFGTLVLRQMGVEAPYDGYLEPGDRTPEIALGGGSQAGGWATFFNYIPVGVDHIVPLGLDHILFVLGLFFLSTRLAPLLWQISAFTLAHTITLALAALGYVSVPASIVEPLIALSIVYVAVENLFTSGLNPWRPVIVFGFGLLHGLGFASVLAEFGLPESSFIPALIGFNVGVELGQLMVIAVAFICTWRAVENARTGDAEPWVAAAYLVATVAVMSLVVPVTATMPEMAGDLLPLIAMVSILLGFCAAACVLPRFDGYREIVAMPASILIAVVALYWSIERVFL